MNIVEAGEGLFSGLIPKNMPKSETVRDVKRNSESRKKKEEGNIHPNLKTHFIKKQNFSFYCFMGLVDNQSFSPHCCMFQPDLNSYFQVRKLSIKPLVGIWFYAVVCLVIISLGVFLYQKVDVDMTLFIQIY